MLLNITQLKRTFFLHWATKSHKLLETFPGAGDRYCGSELPLYWDSASYHLHQSGLARKRYIFKGMTGENKWKNHANVWAGLGVNTQAGSTKNNWKTAPHPYPQVWRGRKEWCLELCPGRGDSWQRLRPHVKKSALSYQDLAGKLTFDLFLSLSYSPGASHWPSLIRTQGQDGTFIPQWINLPRVQCWKRSPKVNENT